MTNKPQQNVIIMKYLGSIKGEKQTKLYPPFNYKVYTPPLNLKLIPFMKCQ